MPRPRCIAGLRMSVHVYDRRVWWGVFDARPGSAELPALATESYALADYTSPAEAFGAALAAAVAAALDNAGAVL